jgi:nucleoside-diphosphate-sugar epimerase
LEQSFPLSSTVLSHRNIYLFRNLSLTNLVVYNLLFPNGVFMPASRYVDFRDVAQAHIGALDSKLDKKNRKRIVFVSPHGLTVKDVLDIIKKDRPDLERRFTTAPAPQFPYDKLDVDFDS